MDIAPLLDAVAVVAAIRRHTMDRTPFTGFRRDVAFAGVQYWEVNMNARTCTYFGIDGGKHVESVPTVRRDQSIEATPKPKKGRKGLSYRID